MDDLAAIRGNLQEIEHQMRQRQDRGKVADCIPELARVSPNRFEMSVCLANGTQISIGDADIPFSVQSISKVFTLAIAFGRFGDVFGKVLVGNPRRRSSIQAKNLRHGTAIRPICSSMQARSCRPMRC